MNRRRFLSSSAIAAGGIAAVAGPVVAVKTLQGGPGAPPSQAPARVVTNPSAPTSSEPVMAYLRNARTHEVTVMSGTTETTYHDPVLAQRLIDAAGGVVDGLGR
jgi:hypothetical protein